MLSNCFTMGGGGVEWGGRRSPLKSLTTEWLRRCNMMFQLWTEGGSVALITQLWSSYFVKCVMDYNVNILQKHVCNSLKNMVWLKKMQKFLHKTPEGGGLRRGIVSWKSMMQHWRMTLTALTQGFSNLFPDLWPSQMRVWVLTHISDYFIILTVWNEEIDPRKVSLLPESEPSHE